MRLSYVPPGWDAPVESVIDDLREHIRHGGKLNLELAQARVTNLVDLLASLPEPGTENDPRVRAEHSFTLALEAACRIVEEELAELGDECQARIRNLIPR